MMKKKVLVVVALFIAFLQINAQDIFPRFINSRIEIRFPTSLTGCMEDPGNTLGEEFVYTLTGHIFNSADGKLYTENFSGKSRKSTPYQILTELVYAYQQKDVEKIISLYDKGSRPKAREIFYGDQANEILEVFSQVRNVVVLMGMEYQEGYLVFLHAGDLGINMNYFTKKGKKYYLSSLDDKSPVSWNLGMYWKYRPLPLQSPTIISKSDSIKFNELGTIRIQLNNNENWITIFKSRLGEPAIFTLQDNGPDDLNKEPGIVDITIPASRLFSKGVYSLNLVESNYPINKVAPYLMEKAVKFDLKIY